MVGGRYRLIKPTVAVLRTEDGDSTCRMLPEGAEVLVEGISDGGQTLRIRYQKDEFWMFIVDLSERGVRVEHPRAENGEKQDAYKQAAGE